MRVRVVLALVLVALFGQFGANAMSCEVCRIASNYIKDISRKGNSSVEQLIKAADFICILLRIEDSAVCRSIIVEFEDELIYTFSHTALSGEEICAIAFGAVCPPSNASAFTWSVPIPSTPKPPVKPIPPPKPGAPKLRVLHLTDIHIDLQYQIGANANCKEPMCCRQTSGVPSRESDKAGRFGDYRKCDAPLWLIENMFQYIASNEEYDYIVWTGDISPHDVWNQSRDSQLHNFYMVDGLFKKYFPGKMIFPSLGNHEGVPVDGFPPPYVQGGRSLQWLLDELSHVWPTYNLPSSIIPTVQRGGFYSVKVAPNFRVISLNNNYCNNLNLYLLINTTDPVGQLQWLVGQLQEAENNGEKVHILFHIPTGLSDCIKAWSWNYHRIINRYESTVMAQFAGHTHNDELEIFYDEVDRTRPVAITYVGLSVTPFSYLNPGYRIFEVDGFYDGSTYAILNHFNTIANLSDANLKGALQWYREYDAKSAYGMSSLNPTDWGELIDDLKKDNALFQKFYQYYTKSYDGRPPCQGNCKEELIRRMKSSRSYEN